MRFASIAGTANPPLSALSALTLFSASSASSAWRLLLRSFYREGGQGETRAVLSSTRNFPPGPGVTRLEGPVTVTSEDDRLLIEAAQADPARFVELYDRYVDRVYAYVSRRTRNRATAEDLTSQVFERALGTIGRFEWRGVPVAAWLFRIAANALADHWKQVARDAHEAPPELPDAAETADIERRLALYQQVERLPDVQRQVIEMRFVEEKSIREVASALGRSEGAIKQLQLRALENLRKGMGGGND